MAIGFRILELLFERRTHSIFTLVLLFLYIFDYRVEHVNNWLNHYTLKAFPNQTKLNALVISSSETSSSSGYHLEQILFMSKNSTDQACSVPRLKPYTNAVKAAFKKSPTFHSCSKYYPLLFNSTLEGYIEPAKSLQEFQDYGIISCCFKVLERGVTHRDNRYSLSKRCYKLSLERATRMSIKHEFIVITCAKFDNPKNPKSKTSKKNYDMHAFVHPKKYEVANGENFSVGEDKVNVVILGLDSTSRMNFIRTMPKSYEFLVENLGAVDMSGYNKVEDNTFPNLMPMLTSLSGKNIGNSCGKKKTYDSCPIIWKRFKEHGYITSFTEDAPGISLFNFERKGFINPPTDYYLRNFGLAAESLVGAQGQICAKLCWGPRLTFKVLLDYIKKFVFKMNKLQKSFFQFTWSTAMTHDYLNAAELGDIDLFNLLEFMNEKGHLNNTVVILMSDHGHRMDEFRSTLQGQLEDRLPFMIFQLPQWLKEKYSKAYENMQANRNRLVTTYDLYETLGDLLNLKELHYESIEKRTANVSLIKKKGVSLFLPVPKARTCEMAGVSINFCSCNYLKQVSVKKHDVKKAAASAVKVLNKLLKPYPDCATLSLKSILMAQYAGSGITKADWKGYLVNFQTSPGGGKFEALVSRIGKYGWNVTGSIGRTNLYRNQSHCVHDVVVKLYCFCQEKTLKFTNLTKKL